MKILIIVWNHSSELKKYERHFEGKGNHTKQGGRLVAITFEDIELKFIYARRQNIQGYNVPILLEPTVTGKDLKEEARIRNRAL